MISGAVNGNEVSGTVRSSELSETFGRTIQFFQNLLVRYGGDIRALDYASPETQLDRFRVMSEAMPLSSRRILDIGCGLAHFADYVQQRFQGVQYIGVDICPEMITEAKRRHPALDLRVANILEPSFKGEYDFVMANGIFYLLGEVAWPMMQRIVERMYSLAGTAVAFSSLSTWATRKQPNEFYADPLLAVDFCRKLTSRIVLRHDYHPGDFTVYMYKAANP